MIEMRHRDAQTGRIGFAMWTINGVPGAGELWVNFPAHEAETFVVELQRTADGRYVRPGQEESAPAAAPPETISAKLHHLFLAWLLVLRAFGRLLADMIRVTRNVR